MSLCTKALVNCSFASMLISFKWNSFSFEEVSHKDLFWNNFGSVLCISLLKGIIIVFRLFRSHCLALAHWYTIFHLPLLLVPWRFHWTGGFLGSNFGNFNSTLHVLSALFEIFPGHRTPKIYCSLRFWRPWVLLPCSWLRHLPYDLLWSWWAAKCDQCLLETEPASLCVSTCTQSCLKPAPAVLGTSVACICVVLLVIFIGIVKVLQILLHCIIPILFSPKTCRDT